MASSQTTLTSGRGGVRAVAQLVSRTQVRAEHGELDAPEDVAGIAAPVVKAGSVRREADTRRSRRTTSGGRRIGWIPPPGMPAPREWPRKTI